MQNKQNLLKLFLLLFIACNVSYAESNVLLSQNNLTIKLVDVASVTKLALPAHDFKYVVSIPQEESSSDPLFGSISYDAPTNVQINRNDGKYLIADLTVTDPAIGGRVIWDGKVAFDEKTKQLTITTREQNPSYEINLKPQPENNTFEIDMLSI